MKRKKTLRLSVRFLPLKPPADSTRFAEAQGFSENEITRLFGVPAHLLIGPSYGAIAEEAHISFLKGVLTKTRVLTMHRKRRVKGGTR
jgi:hypothetical protein